MKKFILSSTTYIPLGIALCVIAPASGWVSKINFEIAAHGARIDIVEKQQDIKFEKVCEALKAIEGRLSRIEGQLQRIDK